jgi:hypothetical protein
MPIRKPNPVYQIRQVSITNPTLTVHPNEIHQPGTVPYPRFQSYEPSVTMDNLRILPIDNSSVLEAYAKHKY